jgi:hypothetical protein
VPPCAVKHHDNSVVGVACANLIEKELHAPRIDVRQDQ